jgi:hypothetical protein
VIRSAKTGGRVGSEAILAPPGAEAHAPLAAVYCPATANLPRLGTALIGRSGRIQKVMTMANSSSPTETANGSVQLPVRSRIQAKATGETMRIRPTMSARELGVDRLQH